MASPLRGDGEQVPTSSSAAMPHGLRMPDAERLAPVLDGPIHAPGAGRPPVFWMLGAHGGAGASTLARAWAPAGNALRSWPSADKYPLVVVVARTHITGLRAAHDLVLQAAARQIGSCVFLGLVTVADAPGKLPSTLRRRLDVVETAARTAGGQTWQLPYLPEYRVTAPEQMPIWDPTAAAPEQSSRWKRSDASAQVAPEIAAAGADIFAAAREAVTR